MLNELRIETGYWYLASPYSKYPHGLNAAAQEIARVAGALLKRGIPVYSPIVHSHWICRAAGIDPLAHDFWMGVDHPHMVAAHGLILTTMESWGESAGMKAEAETFNAMGKPIARLDPQTLRVRAILR